MAASESRDAGGRVTLDSALGPVVIRHPPGTFPPSPATRLMVRAIAGSTLTGVGLDWGCGTGALAIAAARLPDVRRVVGLDLSERDVEAARQNANENGVGDCTRFFVADGFEPVEAEGRAVVDGLRGQADFVVANPPASEGDDGFAFRRTVLAGAARMLRPGGVALVQILSAYGVERIRGVATETPGMVYEGLEATTPVVALDLTRPSLRRQLRDYAAEEGRGGRPYRFEGAGGRSRTATAALANFRRDGTAPRARWQAHRFRRLPDDGGPSAPADRPR